MTYLNKTHSIIVEFYRGSYQGCSMKKDVLRNFPKFTGKYLFQSLFFNKVAGLRPATLLKKRLWHRCFPVNFMKFLRTPFLQNTSGWLFLILLLKEFYVILSFNKEVKRLFKCQNKKVSKMGHKTQNDNFIISYSKFLDLKFMA